MHKLRLQDLDVAGKKVLMRVDFNVPFNKDGTIADDTRIRASLASIEHILKAGGAVILMSHLGRPNGTFDPEYSLFPCAQALEKILNRPVLMATECIGESVQLQAKELKMGEVLLLENLRFHAAEENPDSDPSFAKQLAQMGDLYVNDAFGAAHRNHSSTVAITHYFPKRAAAGLLLQKEIDFLSVLATRPKRPFYAIIGGAKISSKIGVLKTLINKIDALFIGGAMSYTFFKAEGIDVGSSLCEPEYTSQALEIIQACQQRNIPLYLPKDHIIATGVNNDAMCQIVSTRKDIEPEWQGVDIGPMTFIEWRKALKSAATVFWNGPVGIFEFPPFAKGTEMIAKCLANLDAITVVGGGDSLAAIHALGLQSQFSHLSTGGGASLEYLEFGHLPGIDALSDAL